MQRVQCSDNHRLGFNYIKQIQIWHPVLGTPKSRIEVLRYIQLQCTKLHPTWPYVELLAKKMDQHNGLDYTGQSVLLLSADFSRNRLICRSKFLHVKLETYTENQKISISINKKCAMASWMSRQKFSCLDGHETVYLVVRQLSCQSA